MKTIVSFLFLVSMAFASTLQASSSLDREEHLLDGTSFTFQYQNAGAMDISFADGELSYKWIAGRMAKEPQKTYSYKSTKIDSDIYLVNWHEPDTNNFVTMVYNFKSNSCAVSVISKYASEKPFMGFQSGVIEHVVKK